MRTHFLSLAVVCLVAHGAMGQAPRSGDGQLGQNISWIPIDETTQTLVMGQVTRDGRLFLTPNEAFFPRLGLAAVGEGTVADVDNLNGGQSFSRIEKWDVGDSAQWGLHCTSEGALRVRVWASASGSDAAMSLTLGNSNASFPIAPSASPTMVLDSQFNLPQPGLAKLNLVCNASAQDLALHWIEISGPATKDAAVVRKRWRPAAAHTKFSSSAAPDNVRLWVMEMDALPGELDFYSPITTPFGYYGPTWNADGTVHSSFNFSLWSYRRGAPEPPVAQLSHLLAVGDRDAEFGRFGHEGTGVKVRSWQPLQGQQGQRQALALRVQPGNPYDTYYSYFYASEEKRWRLFGVGNKFNNGKPIQSLWVGSFVEVPGRPHVQRTGSVPRVMRYRGWIMTESGKWYSLDQMANGNIDRQTGLTHTQRGLSDGWFFLQTGGWQFRKPPSQSLLKLPKPTSRQSVGYLTAQDIAFLQTVPCKISMTSVRREGQALKGHFDVTGAANDAEVTAYWGSSDSLTLADRWEHHRSLGRVSEGANPFTLDENVPGKGPVFVRLLLSNSEGKFWMERTTVLTDEPTVLQ